MNVVLEYIHYQLSEVNILLKMIVSELLLNNLFCYKVSITIYNLPPALLPRPILRRSFSEGSITI